MSDINKRDSTPNTIVFELTDLSAERSTHDRGAGGATYLTGQQSRDACRHGDTNLNALATSPQCGAAIDRAEVSRLHRLIT